MGGPSIYGGPVPESRRRPLRMRHQAETISGLVKYAYLELDDEGRPWFRGTGGHDGYRTDERAVCGQKQTHPVPDTDCTCGFWVPYVEKGKISRPSGSVELEVEIGGRIIRGSEGVYRAQWQRVLSVTLPASCAQGSHYGRNGCAGPSRWLCVTENGYGGAQRLAVSCAVHMRRASRVIARPVSWLREELQTEIRPGDVSDTIPEPEEDRLAAVDAVARQQYPVSELLQIIDFPSVHREGDIFRVCIDITSRMQYEFMWMPSAGWQVNAIYHPMLEPWGWGTPAG